MFNLNDARFTLTWGSIVQNNVAAFWPDDSFRYIVVGNEVIPESLAQFILLAMRNVATALAAAGLQGQIKVSTSVDTCVLGDIFTKGRT
ncbi:beta-1,3-glucanase [Canna indica]|uniref:Beta-1,3-glucanase n=1 Tax=Canna indica TaxID=4628 RepID=A0AAQ3Q737_9LILI|nr:beta-1,3-glucanase [Canna indica]